MSEVLKPFERIRLPVEEEVWEMFDGFLREKEFVPRWIVLVGDDGNGTLARLAAESYPESQILIVDREPAVINRLRQTDGHHGWSVIAGDITDSHTIDEIVTKTSGGADAVFMKHGVHMNLPGDQENVVSGLFGLLQPAGIVGFSVPTFTVGWWVRPPEAFIDRTMNGGLFHSTVYIGNNTLERQRRGSKSSRS